MHTLQTKHLTKHFDTVKAITDLSISFEPGKITGVIGPNGSGKSTFINTLTGLTPITSGSIGVAEKVELTSIVSNDMPVYGITRTFQEVRLFEQMSVLDNILVVTTCRGWFKSIFEKHSAYHLAIAEKVLKRVGIWQFHNKLAVNLSYGQRKLLEIARVLAMSEIGKAQVIFFDEPYAGLFPEMVKLVSEIMKELRSEGKTVILVEHNMDLIRELSDKVIVLDSGTLLAEGNANHVLSRKDVVEAYLGE
ncbi:MAG: ATP-binding cassette domain-containing protein [Candidatus Taylorbacteria bacterium]|nr:ATP-binding cassette domain-containing protein [Candidatus Taylorbacteria bacterium]